MKLPSDIKPILDEYFEKLKVDTEPWEIGGVVIDWLEEQGHVLAPIEVVDPYIDREADELIWRNGYALLAIIVCGYDYDPAVRSWGDRRGPKSIEYFRRNQLAWEKEQWDQ